jgi:hypothetical protein
MSILSNPIVKGVLLVVAVVVVLKMFGSKIPVIGPYISIS